MMTQPAAGTAVIFNRPFGPQCLFACPRGEGTCSVEVKPTPDALWEKHGSDDKPTLTPSIHCTRRCGWHGYVQKGVLKDPIPGLVNFQHVCPSCQEPTIMGVERRTLPEGPAHVQAMVKCPACQQIAVIVIEVPK